MDCHVFRRLCEELRPALSGCRLEKIHQPAPDVLLFTVYGHGRKRYLFLKSGRRSPFLFLADHKIAVAGEPPAFVMFLRKRLCGRRVLEASADWVERRLFLRFPADIPADEAFRDMRDVNPEEDPQDRQERGLWLCLDLRAGASLLHEAPTAPLPPQWPDPFRLDGIAGEDWRLWPVLTPALRRTLAVLPAEEQAALLVDLHAGGGDLFLHEKHDGERELFAWPLPAALRHDTSHGEQVFESALAAAALAGERCVLRDLAERAAAARARPHLAAAARCKRLLDKLDREESRLERMWASQHTALTLQAALYLFAPDEKRDSVLVPPLPGAQPDDSETSGNTAPENPAMTEGPPLCRIPLDPRLTVRENMAALFHTARRGKRGLAMLAGRREAVIAQLGEAEQAAMQARAGVRPPATVGQSGKHAGKKGRTPLPGGKAGGLPKNVQVFRSTDGFLILRGKDAAGNAAVLKMAAPHDLWLHAGGGPGAHVIVRRDHAGQVVPDTTLHQAGSLAILKSWKKDESPVDVVRAAVAHVHPIRGARTGEVRVDKYDEAFSVCPDPSLETALVIF